MPFFAVKNIYIFHLHTNKKKCYKKMNGKKNNNIGLYFQKQNINGGGAAVHVQTDGPYIMYIAENKHTKQVHAA